MNAVNRKLYYYVDNSNLKSLVKDPRLNNDEATISGEIIGELLLDTQNGLKVDYFAAVSEARIKIMNLKTFLRCFIKRQRDEVTYAKLMRIILYIILFINFELYHVSSKIVKIRTKDDKMSFLTKLVSTKV